MQIRPAILAFAIADTPGLTPAALGSSAAEAGQRRDGTCQVRRNGLLQESRLCCWG